MCISIPIQKYYISRTTVELQVAMLEDSVVKRLVTILSTIFDTSAGRSCQISFFSLLLRR